MQLTVIHNPNAGDAPPSDEDLERMLADAGYQVRYQSTRGAWKKALQHPADLVVAAGGDGTVKKVTRELAGSGVPIAVLPFGTANNIAKTLGIVGETADIVAGWRDAPPMPFDLGVASAAGGEERFVEAAGGGALAELIEQGEEQVEEAGAIVGRETDRALYLLRRILEEAEPATWRVEVDGEDRSGAYVAVEALNIRFAGPNVPWPPTPTPETAGSICSSSATPSDGRSSTTSANGSRPDRPGSARCRSAGPDTSAWWRRPAPGSTSTTESGPVAIPRPTGRSTSSSVPAPPSSSGRPGSGAGVGGAPPRRRLLASAPHPRRAGRGDA